jgi:uncharacterized protein YndB with AHSA1/START domain
MAAQNTAPAAKAAMLIRKPVHEVFEAMVNPEITSKFWYSKGKGRLDKDEKVVWMWEFYGVSAEVSVEQVEPERSVTFSWGEEDSPTNVHITFEPRGDNATFISVEETGFREDMPDLIEKIVGQTDGWALVMAAMKAYLEQGINIKVVEDRHPDLIVSKPV